MRKRRLSVVMLACAVLTTWALPAPAVAACVIGNTMGPAVRRLDLVPFPGIGVSVDAPPEGATCLVDKRGRVKKVGAGL